MLKQHHSIAAVLSAALLLSAPLSPFAAAQETRLHHAAQHSPERVREMIPGRQINAQDADGDTPLHWALDRDANLTDEARGEIVRLLLESGADLFAQNNSGTAPLHLAARGWSPAEEQILSRVYEMRHAGEKPDINITDTRGNTPLHWAMDHHFPPADHRARSLAAHTLLWSGADPNARNRHGISPMHMAAHQSAEITGSMLNRGGDPNIEDGRGFTALYWAVSAPARPQNGSVEDIVRQLMDAGGDPDHAGKNGETPLAYVRARGIRGGLAGLLERVNQPDEAGTPKLIQAIQESARLGNNDESEALRLIDVGANINAQDAEGMSPMHHAVLHRQFRVMDALIENRADLDVRNNLGYTPLHMAAASQDGAIVVRLVSAGANVEIRNDSGETPLCSALREMKRESFSGRPAEAFAVVEAIGGCNL